MARKFPIFEELRNSRIIFDLHHYRRMHPPGTLCAEPFSIIICEIFPVDYLCISSPQQRALFKKSHFKDLNLLSSENRSALRVQRCRGRWVFSADECQSAHTHTWAFINSGVSRVRAESVSFWGQPARSRCRRETLAFSRRRAWLENFAKHV
jgi:hypothetical protein